MIAGVVVDNHQADGGMFRQSLFSQRQEKLAARDRSDLAFARITANRFTPLNGRLALVAAPAMHMARPQTIAAGIFLIAAIHFVLFGYFLFRTAITLPISDMFTYIADYLRFRAGQVGLLDYLWQPHGEHRLLWIRLLTWADVEFLHTRGIAFMAAATASMLATAILVWHVIQRATPKLAAPLTLLAPMLVLTSANAVDCSVPINTTYPITVFLAVLSLVLFAGAGEFERRPNLWRTAAIPAAIGSSLATAAGLLMWPILLWISWCGRVGGRWLAILVGVGATYVTFYSYNLPPYGLAPALDTDVASFVSRQHLFELVDYFVAFLGLPFAREPALGLVGRLIGLVLLLAAVSAVLLATFSNRLKAPSDQFAVGMIMLGVGSAALAAVGRSELVNEVPVRYTMFTTTLHVGLFCLVLPRLACRLATPYGRVLLNSSGLLFAALLLMQQVFIGRIAAQTAAAIARDADCFAEGIYTGPISSVVTRAPAGAAEVLNQLRQQGLLAPRSSNCVTP
jgi:hypothetical protein